MNNPIPTWGKMAEEEAARKQMAEEILNDFRLMSDPETRTLFFPGLSSDSELLERIECGERTLKLYITIIKRHHIKAT